MAKRLKSRRGRGGRRPVLIDQQKEQIRKIACSEIEKAFRSMLRSIGIYRGRVKS